ncbi:hypothetical protein QO010_003641 [Caulobacter ginsengisoli]|uniref:DUF2846 domain-containing protein n=1 Tax=Caulobacter ginsengisoli TaxID=400775 RepID=A0ABU0IV15_9CAUL|nr:DUF2846 domain-containing protein [Caulobacter ginsengisoli]MDQ0465849.1 hypothetical protein [Caulobacter ginsengisoli]
MSKPAIAGLMILGAAMLAPGLAGAQSTADAPAAAPAADAPAPAPTGDPRVGAPAEGMAQIVFYRPSNYFGGAVSFKVREGEAELGQLSNNSYFILQIAPGKHTFVVHSEAADDLTMEVEAGETYFVRGAMAMGVVLYRPNLSPSDQSSFTALPKLKLAKPIKVKAPKK